jgi:hypothetical protein
MSYPASLSPVSIRSTGPWRRLLACALRGCADPRRQATAWAVCALTTWLPVAPLAAQGPVCRVQTAYGMGNISPTSNILQIDTGWRLSPSTTSNTNGGGVPFATTFSLAQVATSAAFGRLYILASGQARNWNGNGTSLWLSPTAFDQPPTLRFQDTVVVLSAVLPVGTPVQLQSRVRLAGFAVVAGAAPTRTFGAQIRVANDPSSLSTGAIVAMLSDTTGLVTATINTTVGATLYVEGRLSVYVEDAAVLGSLPASASYGVELEGLFDFASLTAGATLAHCSGAQYPSLSASVQTIGAGCGAAPPILASTLPQLGTTATLTTTSAPPAAPVFVGLAVGAPVAQQSGACTLWLDLAVTSIAFAGVASAAGTATTTLGIPSSGSLAGLHLTAQALPLLNVGPFLGFGELSNGLELVIGP